MLTADDCRRIAELSLAASRAMDRAAAATDAGNAKAAQFWYATHARLSQRRGEYMETNAERLRGAVVALDGVPEEIRTG